MKIDSHKIILLHPGKTGGTSIEHTLRDLYLGKDFKLISNIANRDIMFGFDKELKIYLQHACLTSYSKLNIQYKSYKTITTVRRPYERIFSCYYYNGKSKYMTFEDFVTKELEKCYYASINTGYAIGHFSPQYFYIDNNGYSVTNLVRLENFKEDCYKVGIGDVKYHLSKTVGTSNYKNYLDAYSNKTKDIVYSLYKQDFKLCGYKK